MSFANNSQRKEPAWSLRAGRYSSTVGVVTHCVYGCGQLTEDGTTGGDTERCGLAKGAQCSEVTCMLVQVRSDMALQGDLPGEKNPSTVTHCEMPSLKCLISRTVPLY